MDPAFFTVRTRRARTHQQQLACIHHVFNGRADSKKRMAHLACMNLYACWLLLLLAGAGCCCCCWLLLLVAAAQQQPAAAAATSSSQQPAATASSQQ
jgi:hypothetical protein